MSKNAVDAELRRRKSEQRAAVERELAERAAKEEAEHAEEARRDGLRAELAAAKQKASPEAWIAALDPHLQKLITLQAALRDEVASIFDVCQAQNAAVDELEKAAAALGAPTTARRFGLDEAQMASAIVLRAARADVGHLEGWLDDTEAPNWADPDRPLWNELEGLLDDER